MQEKMQLTSEQQQETAISLAWKVMYGEDTEILDPTKMENRPQAKKKRQERVRYYRDLLDGNNGVLFSEWAKRIKRTNLALLFTPIDQLCSCDVCRLIVWIRSMLDTMMEAELILAADKKIDKFGSE